MNLWKMLINLPALVNLAAEIVEWLETELEEFRSVEEVPAGVERVMYITICGN